ncbi:hypothetical protein HIM_08170 [Hirsutella minnesotensis 3608]|uniref:Kinetochore protein fta4 n=1 Tax=Hirsutella minnesotensis 3608 TaxID=1043627 RepID=A0A0F7ZHE5_9HYPO|nr:hypothetical protein HIM_08170 [Hirsutella minnesotensis 3608]
MATSTPTPTIPSLKQAFLAAQVNLLAHALSPSQSWRDSNDASEHPIPASVLEDVVFALNQTIQQHCRRVYAPQASRHVAEQISNAYSREAERKIDAEGQVDGAISKDLDLVENDVIESLAPSWPSEKEADDFPLEARRYVDAVSRLAQLNEQRKILKQKNERLRRLKAALEPFSTPDVPDAGIQENLNSRNGPVEAELEKMRFLLARVAGRVSELPANPRNSANVNLAAVNGARKRAIDDFLSDPSVFPS